MEKHQLLEHAKLSLAAYRSLNFKELGYQLIKSIDIGGAQAYILTKDNRQYIVFRGSDERVDWQINFNAAQVRTEHPGKLHRGFYISASRCEMAISSAINHDLPTYFVGHSYGGALAQIMAVMQWPIKWRTVVTFGAPMVGDAEFVNYADSKALHIRVRNNNDIVTQLPGNALGYEHGGTLVYLDYFGNVSPRIRFRDRIISRLRAWSKAQFFDGKYDHDLNRYIAKLSN
jgi:predicted lipase